MSRAIDADTLEELFREVIGGIAKKPEMNGNLEHMVRASAMVIEMIQDAPTIEPRKKGKWLASDDMYETGICSCCRWDSREPFDYAIANFHFCPNCGERMEGES